MGKTITEINNSETIKELEIAADIQLANRIRRKLKSDVQPVININPKDYRVIDLVKHLKLLNTTTETAVYTVSANKHFYMVSFQMNSYSTIAALTITLRCTINGERVIFYAERNQQTGTAAVTFSFPVPIKIDPETTITMQQSHDTVNNQSDLTIYGYEVQNAT